MHFMLDLETLSSASNAVIISIGIVEFSPTGIWRKFYTNVDPSKQDGLHISADTVMWWLQQNAEAREAVLGPKVPFHTALYQVREFLGSNPIVWGNGADFDNVVLRNAFAAAGMSKPWSHRNNRCYRTLKALRPDIKMEAAKGTVAHNALDDAHNQALHAIKLLDALEAWE